MTPKTYLKLKLKERYGADELKTNMSLADDHDCVDSISGGIYSDGIEVASHDGNTCVMMTSVVPVSGV